MTPNIVLNSFIPEAEMTPNIVLNCFIPEAELGKFLENTITCDINMEF